MVEGDVRQRQSGRCAVECADVGVVLAIGGQDERDDLGLAGVTLGKERPQRPVDEPGGDGFFLGRAAFALEEAAGEAPACGVIFTVVHRQREEVPGLAGALRAGGGQDHGVADAYDARALGLFGQTPGFEG